MNEHRNNLIKPIINNIISENEEKMKIKEKLNIVHTKTEGKKCNLNWPICIKDIENDFQHNIAFYFAFRTQNFPPIINESYFNPNKNIKSKINNNDQIFKNECDDVVIERKIHKCNQFYYINLTSDTSISDLSNDQTNDEGYDDNNENIVKYKSKRHKSILILKS